MREILRGTWALLLGIALLMLGHGLQGTLLGVRANLEAFPAAVTGLVMSGYYVGLLIGSLRVPVLVARVGHVRVARLDDDPGAGQVRRPLHLVPDAPAHWLLL